MKQTKNTLYRDYRHFINTLDTDGHNITPKRLLDWSKSNNPKFICIFCSKEATITNGFMFCQRCHSYKGIMPDIAGLN